MYYTGIGSRRAGAQVMLKMQAIAQWLAQLGFTLRSGAADGADTAFEQGCDAAGGLKEIWLPWPGFNGRDRAQRGYCYPNEANEAMAKEIHPAFERLSQGPRKLHARNTGQVLGKDLATPSEFVVCWTPDGCETEGQRTRNTGGTATAIVLAHRRGIPVYNLYNAGALERLEQHVESLLGRFHADGATPSQEEIFVFGSNLCGRHGAGSALVAKQRFGAQPGQGQGRHGQSYAIPTKDGRGSTSLSDPLATLPLETIKEHVEAFLDYAREHPKERFFVVRVGCGLAGYEDRDIAPLFLHAPANCSFPEPWKPWLGVHEFIRRSLCASSIAPAINIASAEKGLGGALTNMSARARERGCIKHHYPVTVNGVEYVDLELAYQSLKRPGDDAYNDALMIDLIALKFSQHKKLFDLVLARGGAEWLKRCSHHTGARSERFQAWEGEGLNSRFIRNLVAGFEKALAGRGALTRVVDVREAPFDVYIGRACNGHPQSIWHNPFKVGEDGSLEEVVQRYHDYLQTTPALKARVGELKGLTLGCWCKSRSKPDALCHGDVLAALAQGQPWEAPQPIQASLF